jgi:hypothetical protein
MGSSQSGQIGMLDSGMEGATAERRNPGRWNDRLGFAVNRGPRRGSMPEAMQFLDESRCNAKSKERAYKI